MKEMKVNSFIDNKKDKYLNMIRDLNTIALDDIIQERDFANILITSSYKKEILNQLVDAGFKNIYYFTEKIFLIMDTW